jgi:hypothetical protein
MTAQLRPIDLVAPGFLGINLAQASNVLSPQFATAAKNCVIDSSGRLAARAGYTDQTTTNITANPNVETIFEYRKGDGTRSLICAWDGGIANDITDPEGNDISGSVTDSDGRWWMQNFNNLVIGFQDGQKPIVYNGTGNFATVAESDGTAPTSHNGIGLCAYGRVWALDSDGVTIKYSYLLDETDWAGTGTGSIDMSSVWTHGQDTVTAIAAFNGRLVIFGKNHIVFYGDDTTGVIGIDPDQLEVKDIITGTGCLSQWSIQPVGESDMLYLSRNGVQSLQRVLVQQSNPITNLSKNVRAQLMAEARAESETEINSFYSPKEGFYGITFPTSGTTWVLDQRFRFRDKEGDEISIVTSWTLAPRSWCVRDNESILLGNAGEVGLYGGNDDDGSSFRFVYQSPWLDLGEGLANRLKILKRIGAIVFAKSQSDIVFKWGADFSTEFNSITESLSGDGGDEWGVGEWGVAEWSGGLSLRILKVPARDTAQYFRLGIEGDITGSFALQQLELFAKIGRLA